MNTHNEPSQMEDTLIDQVYSPVNADEHARYFFLNIKNKNPRRPSLPIVGPGYDAQQVPGLQPGP